MLCDDSYFIAHVSSCQVVSYLAVDLCQLMILSSLHLGWAGTLLMIGAPRNKWNWYQSMMRWVKMRHTKHVKRVIRTAPHLAECGSVSMPLTKVSLSIISCGPMDPTWITPIGATTTPESMKSALWCIVVAEVIKALGRPMSVGGRNHMESVANAQVLHTSRILFWCPWWLDHVPCGWECWVLVVRD